MMPKTVASASETAATPQLLRLTKMNYRGMLEMMECYLEAQGLWDAIVNDDVLQKKDRQALAAIFSAISEDFLEYLDTKKTAKQNWETLRVIHVGVDLVVESRV